MVFSSIPIYLDPPSWQQEQNHQPAEAEAGATSDSSQLLLPPPQPGGSGGGPGSIRPESIAERAQLAKIPQPEASLKCPRCDSTNTKFCYFNNYSLSQPRHFCKTCRRYWTRGGALRNVPVGGSCRRNNKRKKGGIHRRSKSPVVSHEPHTADQSAFPAGNGGCTDILGQIPAGAPSLPLLPPLNHLGEYNSCDTELNFGGLQVSSAAVTGLQIGSSSSGILEQFRSLQQLQQFPFWTSFVGAPPLSSVFFSEGEGVQPASYSTPVRFKAVEGGLAPVATVKAEETIQGVNLSKNFSGASVTGVGNEQFWGGNGNHNAWTDLSGFSGSSTSNHL